MGKYMRQAAPRFAPNSTVHPHTCTGTPVDIIAAANTAGTLTTRTPTSVYVSMTNAGDNNVYVSPVNTASSGIILSTVAGSSSHAVLIELSPGAAVFVSESGTPAETLNAVFMYD